jgi:hypothetical protein
MGKVSQHSHRKHLHHAALWALGWSAFVLGSAPWAHAEFQLRDWKLRRAQKGEWNVTGSVSTFSTQSNRDGAGNLVEITGLEQYRRMAANLAVEWGAHSKLTFYGRGTWLWNEIQAADSSARRFGLSDQSLGLSLRALERGVTLDLQVQADFPVYSNVRDAAKQLPFLGDSSMDITVGGFLTAPLWNAANRSWKAVAGAGYTIRSDSYSSAIPWSAELQTRPEDGNGLLFSLGAAGFQSLRTDPRGDLNISASTFSPPSGGSFLIDAVNPSLAAASVSLGYQSRSSTAVTASWRKTIWGQAVADGSLFEVALNWSFPGSLSGKSGERKAIPPKPLEKSQSLTQYAPDGKVTAVVNTRTLLIDQGSDAGLAMGDLIDIFSVLPDGGVGEPIARGQVVHLDSKQAQISLLEIYQETAIKQGFIARKPIAL